MQLESATKSYLLDCEARNLSPATVALYRIIMKSLTDNLSEPTTADCRIFLSELSARTSKSTAKRYYTAMKTFFQFCHDEGILETNPMTGVRPPKHSEPIITPLTQEEVVKLIEAADSKSFLGLRNRCILLILVDCGLRASELISLNLEDVDMAQQVLIVRHGKGDKSRVVPFGSVTAQAIRRYLIKRGDQNTNRFIVNCYGEPTRRENLLTIVQNAGRKVGLSVYPHLLRHTMAVSYLRNGGDVFSLQRLLGHSDLSMTRKYCELANTDVIDKHRLHSPADNLGLKSDSRRRRIK